MRCLPWARILATNVPHIQPLATAQLTTRYSKLSILCRPSLDWTGGDGLAMGCFVGYRVGGPNSGWLSGS